MAFEKSVSATVVMFSWWHCASSSSFATMPPVWGPSEMLQWAVIGIFMLGAAMGALLTWIACASQILEIQRVLGIISAKHDSNGNLMSDQFENIRQRQL